MKKKNCLHLIICYVIEEEFNPTILCKDITSTTLKRKITLTLLVILSHCLINNKILKCIACSINVDNKKSANSPRREKKNESEILGPAILKPF